MPVPLGIRVLRKDFIIDEYQLFEARAFGADAVLLIAAILERRQLSDLYAVAGELGLECLVELHDLDEIDKVDFDRMRLIGINNRNLRTLQTSIEQTLRVCPHIPAGVTIVSESGIGSASDLHTLAGHGIHAALIGEHFMRAEDPALALRELLTRFTGDQSGGSDR
jgi:indole-3-glycerol phosphate synthase